APGGAGRAGGVPGGWPHGGSAPAARGARHCRARHARRRYLRGHVPGAAGRARLHCIPRLLRRRPRPPERRLHARHDLPARTAQTHAPPRARRAARTSLRRKDCGEAHSCHRRAARTRCVARATAAAPFPARRRRAPPAGSITCRAAGHESRAGSAYMRIAFVVNDVDTEVPTAATTVMAHAASRRGHDVFMVGVGDLEYFEDGHVGALARAVRPGAARTQASFLRLVQGEDADLEVISSADLDVLFLRYNPSEEIGDDAWKQDAGILFGRLAVAQGVLVLDDPDTLAFATDKLYFQHFPEDVRPRTIITRSLDR